VPPFRSYVVICTTDPQHSTWTVEQHDGASLASGPIRNDRHTSSNATPVSVAALGLANEGTHR
jgi:hypothetical protein